MSVSDLGVLVGEAFVFPRVSGFVWARRTGLCFGSFCGGGCNQALELRVGGCLFRFFGAAGAAVAVVGGASITLLLVSKRLR